MSAMHRVPAMLDTVLRDSVNAPSLPGHLVITQPGRIGLTIADDPASIAEEWKAFEKEADGTVFQSFAWQSAWMEHVAPHRLVTPAIVLGRDPLGSLLFILPLAVERRALGRTLIFLATDLCDYNMPLLAPDFAGRAGAGGFPALWREILSLLERDPRYRPDAVILEKMPETVGSQPNPLMALSLSDSPNGAHLTELRGCWDEFYREKRSSSTRRHDRSKRKRLGELGEVRVATPVTGTDVQETLTTLMAQKERAFARMGVRNLFGRPGYAAFFRALAADPANRDLVHISRLDIGGNVGAANFGLVHNRRYYHVLASYDDGPAAKYGPGAAHLLDLMEYAIGRGCDTFDFTIGDEDYKRNWSDRFVALKDHRAMLTWGGALSTVPAVCASAVKRTAKCSPYLWRWTIRTRAFLGRLRRISLS
jgi:CelD/BcsL family acetyltransferase involved in cellulose biosynthesis